jgi:hypothetical protein
MSYLNNPTQYVADLTEAADAEDWTRYAAVQSQLAVESTLSALQQARQVLNSSGVLVSPTEAVLFRTASGGTQLLDEVDSWSNRDALRSVLNAGFRRGNSVIRMNRTETEGFEVKPFSVFAPRALAGIGQKILPETTRDRSFMLEMLPQKPEERREPFRLRQIQTAATELKDEIKEWTTAYRSRAAACYDGGRFEYLESFRDRTMDVAQPLAAILEVAYDLRR